MSLHLVFSAGGWQSCQALVVPEDAVVLLGDGAYLVHKAAHGGQMFVLQEDLAIRGLDESSEAMAISYTQLVDLTVKHKPVVSWS
ncbi:MAG: sulfurtransferase complex subunit TusB [bacterium]